MGTGGVPAIARATGGSPVATTAPLAPATCTAVSASACQSASGPRSGDAMSDCPKSNAVARCWSRRKGCGGMNATR